MWTRRTDADGRTTRVGAPSSRYLQLIEEQERQKADRSFANAAEALEALAAIFESDEEIDEFVASVHRWRGHVPDSPRRLA
jgi:hypothetical protein